MSDDNKIKDILDAAKGMAAAIPIYQDAIQPAAKEMGKALETMAKTINLALAPLKALVWGYEQIEDYLVGALAQKLKNIPTERIVTPSLNIAGPAVESLRFTGHESELRELYANLIATSLDSKTSQEAHPAFVEIIKQLTPDEAKMIKLFDKNTSFAILSFVIYDFKCNDKKADSHPLLKMQLLTSPRVEYPNYLSLISIDAGCDNHELCPFYINNLCRLGLTEILPGNQIADPNLYKQLEDQSNIQEIKQYLESINPEKTVRLERGILRVTCLGDQFCKACAIERN